MSCCGCHAVRGAEGHWHHRARVGISWSGSPSAMIQPLNFKRSSYKNTSEMQY